MKKHFSSSPGTGAKNRITDADVALIQAPAWGTDTPPLALASLTAYLRRQGHKVLALDLNMDLYKKQTEKYPDAWGRGRAKFFWPDPHAAGKFAEDNREYLEGRADFIAASGAKIVGFSIYPSSLYISLYLAGLIKGKNKKTIIVFGGPGASRDSEGRTIIKDENVDYVVQGEGEITLAEIVRNKRAGIFCRGALMRKNGEVTDCGDRELIKDLDSLPFPDFSDYDLNDYTGSFKIPLISSRGCCNNCIYCTERTYGRRFRFRTAGGIYNEILYQLKKHPGKNCFYFQDSLVNGNVKELEKLAGLIIKGGVKIRWFGNAAIRKEMTYELLLKLEKSGCVTLVYGMETASVPLMLKAGKVLSKNAVPEKIIRDGYRAKIVCVLNFMFGLPGEKEEEFRETLEFIKRNKDYIGMVNPVPSLCEFFPGTYAREHPDEFDIDLKHSQKYWESKDGANTYLVRLRRFEEFCRLAWDLKIASYYPAPKLLNRNELIGRYHLHTGDMEKAIPYFARAIKKEGLEISAIQRLEPYCHKAGLQGLYEKYFREITEWKKTIKNDKKSRPLEQFNIDARTKNLISCKYREFRMD